MTSSPDLITEELLEARIAKSKNLKITFSAMPEMGHFIPLMRLAAACKQRGHTISFLSYSYNADRCLKMLKQTEIEDVPIEFPDPNFSRDDFMYGVGHQETGNKIFYGGTEVVIEPAKKKL